MAGSRHPIQMLWVSGALPWYAVMSINSFLHHRHRVELYAYDPPPNLPQGCVLKDAGQILPRDCVFVYKQGHHKGHLSGFSNWFRYALLARHGGWWSDCDVICVAPFWKIEQDYVFASEDKPPNPASANPNVMFVRTGSTEIMSKCAAYCESRRDDIDHAETGPVLLNDMAHKLELGNRIVGPGVFNPISFSDTGLFLGSSLMLTAKKYSRRVRNLRPIHMSRQTIGVHLYASVLTQCGAVMSSAPDMPPRSFLAQLIRRHCQPQGALPLRQRFDWPTGPEVAAP
ncbi:MAG TPA: hypothetical protein VGN38_08705 [Caulobacteraceae bacterium]|jgi:hypothetical protein|nr:hypothetical protein [Caulobacteraceae bacterium]